MAKALRKPVGYAHVELDERGVPIIAGTTMKVIELVLAQMAYGWSPEELHFQFPHVSLGQVYSVLGYYWDHKQALDDDIQRRYEIAEQARLNAGPSEVAAKLRAQGLID